MDKPWLKNYPKNVPEEIDLGRYESLKDLLNEGFEKFKNDKAFTNMGTNLTFGQIDDLSKNLAAFFQHELNLKKGDRIAIQMPNILQYPVVLFAAIRAGLVVVNTNPLYTTREMTHQFNDAEVKAVVVLANFADKVEEVLKDTSIKHVIVTEIGDLMGFPKAMVINSLIKHVKKMVPAYNIEGSYKFNQALAKGDTKSFQEEHIESGDLAFLQYTGGTTGVSKGAMLTHKNVVANMLQIVGYMGDVLKPNQEVVATPLPLYHIFSLTVTFTMLFFGAQNILITNPRDIPGFIKTLHRYPITMLPALNTLFIALMNDEEFKEIDFSELKATLAGGMAMQTSAGERWEKLTGVKISEGFGLTETSPVATCNPIDGNAQLGSIGMPVPSTLVKIIDEDGNDLPQGESGEICIKGPQVMKGYWKRPEETKKMITDDGWLKTGDIGLMNPDGFFKIVDRKKDMILVSGFNVFPNEIEEIVSKMEKVLEVAAIGIPDEKSGEVVKVFVVKKDKDLQESEIIDFCRQNLTGYKVPKQVEFRDDLPKSNVGKILRRELRPNA